MAHHYAYSLASLANKVRYMCFTKNRCPSLIGKIQLFSRIVPHLASTYANKSDLDWVNYIRENNKIYDGYHKTRLPFATHNDQFDMHLISWLPGATTRIHTHPKYHIMVSTIIYGKLEETLFTTKYDPEVQTDIVANMYKHTLYAHESSCLEGNTKHAVHNPLDVSTYSLQISMINTDSYDPHEHPSSMSQSYKCGNDGNLCSHHDSYNTNNIY